MSASDIPRRPTAVRPQLRPLTVESVYGALAAGWADFRAAPQFGLFFGGGSNDERGGSPLGVVGGILVAILAPIAAMVRPPTTESVRSVAYQRANTVARAAANTPVLTKRLTPSLSVRMSVTCVPTTLTRTTVDQ